MYCKKPYQKGPLKFGCGQCTPCRINRRRLWTGRMLLEYLEHPTSAFLTLTYNNEYLPEDLCLQKRDVQNFLKRIREQIAPRKIRYYAAGEYGDENLRPHYHLIVYGLSPLEVKLVEKCWTYGFVKIGTVTPQSISYVSGYITKLQKNHIILRELNRSPEFSLMSKDPGLGFGVVARFKKAYETSRGRAALLSDGWFKAAIQTGALQYPLGRYLAAKTAQALSLGDKERTAKLWRSISEAHDRQRGKSRKEIATEYYAKVGQQSYRQRKRTL